MKRDVGIACFATNPCQPLLSPHTQKIEEIFKQAGHPFSWNEHLGYILTCPSNLGTGLRGGVHVKLPHLSKHAKFEEILKRLRLQKRGTGGGGAKRGPRARMPVRLGQRAGSPVLPPQLPLNRQERCPGGMGAFCNPSCLSSWRGERGGSTVEFASRPCAPPPLQRP